MLTSYKYPPLLYLIVTSLDGLPPLSILLTFMRSLGVYEAAVFYVTAHSSVGSRGLG